MYNLARIMYKTGANITELLRVLSPFLSDLTGFSLGIYKCITGPLGAILGPFLVKTSFWHGIKTAQIIHYQNGQKATEKHNRLFNMEDNKPDNT